jgi:hypothetical protein
VIGQGGVALQGVNTHTHPSITDCERLLQRVATRAFELGPRRPRLVAAKGHVGQIGAPLTQALTSE